jgi:hypothetical protein
MCDNPRKGAMFNRSPKAIAKEKKVSMSWVVRQTAD